MNWLTEYYLTKKIAEYIKNMDPEEVARIASCVFNTKCELIGEYDDGRNIYEFQITDDNATFFQDLAKDYYGSEYNEIQ